jgi:biopolymer transport protein ExbD
MARNHRDHYFGGHEKPRIEIIPMIDVMMFLLVFFVLIMTEMIQSAGIQLDLPQSSTSKALKTVKVTLGVDRSGAMYLEGKLATTTEVSGALKASLKSGKVDVIISGDEGTAYQNIVKAMDLARSAGISSIGLATRTP